MTVNKLRVLAFLFSFIFYAIAFAQPIPPGQEPGAEAERFRSEIERKKELEKKKVKVPQIETEEKKEEKPAPESARFVLKEVTITGATVFKPQDFAPIFKPYLNKEVSLKDMEAICEKIKARYKAKGYLITAVYLPEQEITEGKVEIRVAEGRMGDLKIEGNKYFSSALIAKYFHLKKNQLLDINTLTRDILRLNQNPDLEVKVVIGAGLDPQASDVTLTVKDKYPNHLGIGSDNQGTRLVGKYRASAFLRSTNFSDNFDSLFLNTLYSNNSLGESLSYALPLTTYGTKLNIDALYYKMKLGKEYKSFDITGISQIYTLHLSQELILTEDLQANVDIGLELKCIKKKMGQQVTSNDQLRLPYFAFDFTEIDSFFGGGQSTYAPRFVFGTEDFLGASSRNHPSGSRANTGGFFFKYEQALQRTQRMPFESYVTLRSNFQLATHTLVSSEQFQLGGANSIRGYPEGDYLCDLGGSLNFDWVFPMYLIPKSWKLPRDKTPLRQLIQPVFFADVGGGKLKKVLPGERKDKLLWSLGGGLRIRLYDKVYVRLEWAGHFGDDPTPDAGPSTFHLTFQSEF